MIRSACPVPVAVRPVELLAIARLSKTTPPAGTAMLLTAAVVLPVPVAPLVLLAATLATLAYDCAPAAMVVLPLAVTTMLKAPEAGLLSVQISVRRFVVVPLVPQDTVAPSFLATRHVRAAPFHVTLLTRKGPPVLSVLRATPTSSIRLFPVPTV